MVALFLLLVNFVKSVGLFVAHVLYGVFNLLIFIVTFPFKGEQRAQKRYEKQIAKEERYRYKLK